MARVARLTAYPRGIITFDNLYNIPFNITRNGRFFTISINQLKTIDGRETTRWRMDFGSKLSTRK